MSNFTDEQLSANVVGLKVHDGFYFWVDSAGFLTLPSLTVSLDDLKAALRMAESWKADKALNKATKIRSDWRARRRGRR